MLSFFSCFRKKSPPTTVGPWLEQHFPGRFSVLNSNLKMLDVMAQFRGEKRALVADNSDAEVQFFLNWEKGIESLGLDTQTVTDACEHAKAEVAVAREWLGRLQKAGLNRFSVGVVDETLTVQVFGEPSRPVCEKTVATVRTALKDRKDQFPARVFFEIMEPAAYQTEFQAIIPRGHWEVGTGWQRKNLILSWRMEPDAGTTPVWSVNPESGRCSQYREAAFRQAKAWADKHLPKPFFMDADQMAAYDQTPANAGGKVPAIGFSFPYFDKDLAGDSDSEPQGYVYGVYYPEEQTLTEIRKQREF